MDIANELAELRERLDALEIEFAKGSFAKGIAAYFLETALELRDKPIDEQDISEKVFNKWISGDDITVVSQSDERGIDQQKDSEDYLPSFDWDFVPAFLTEKLQKDLDRETEENTMDRSGL